MGLWLAVSAVAFVLRMRRVRPVPPSSLGPGQAGVREPRRPSPSGGAMSVELSEQIDRI